MSGASSLMASLLMLVMLLNFYCIGTSRVRSLVYGVALQGALLAFMPLMVFDEPTAIPVLMTALTLAIKGVVLPLVLLRAMRELPIAREVEPLLGFVTTSIYAAVGTLVAIVYVQSLPWAGGRATELIAAAAMATLFTGFLILVTRLKALVQIAGFLILINGVYIFGMLLVEAMPFVVGVGVLLDLVAAIFATTIIVRRITRAFPTDHAAAHSAEED